MSDKILLALTILELPRIGKVTANKIINFHDETPINVGDIDQLLNDYKKYNKVQTFPSFEKQSLVNANNYAKSILEKSNKEGIKITFIDKTSDSPWVQNLSNIPNPPIIIYTKGSEVSLNIPSITVVGSRKPTDFGIKSAQKIAEFLVDEGFCVISGLALGCDISAHKGALIKQGHTIAILASGLNYITPKQHKIFGDEIIESGGCLVSEYPIDMKPIRSNFVERNRLQAALGMGLIVVETGSSSGTMQTVNFAKKYNKKIACINHDEKYHHIDSVRGNRKLIQEGIIPIKDLKELNSYVSLLLKNQKSLKGQNQFEF